MNMRVIFRVLAIDSLTASMLYAMSTANKSSILTLCLYANIQQSRQKRSDLERRDQGENERANARAHQKAGRYHG